MLSDLKDIIYRLYLVLPLNGCWKSGNANFWRIYNGFSEQKAL